MVGTSLDDNENQILCVILKLRNYRCLLSKSSWGSTFTQGTLGGSLDLGGCLP